METSDEQYPPGRIYIGWGLSTSVLAHVFVFGLILLLAYLAHVQNLYDLMNKGGSLAMSGPAPEPIIEVEIKEEAPPPPPAEIKFLVQKVIPKPVPIPVIPPKPKPVIKHENRPVPRYTAKNATGEGKSAGVSALVVGSSGFPHPDYPWAARVRHIGGTVVFSVTFDGSGQAINAEIISSSGSSLLDSPTRSFILSNWHNAAFAGRSSSAPIEFDPPQ